MAKSRARKLADIIVGAGIDIDGNLTFDGGSTSADLTFADNDKANFGDASDLQIYHDGTNSYITDSGAGNLRISGTLLQLNDASFNKYLLGSGSIVRLYYDDSEKLATTSTGVSVTGGLTSSGNVILGGTGNKDVYLGTTGSTEAAYISRYNNDFYLMNKDSGDLIFGTNNSNKGRFTSSGNFQIGTTTVIDSSRNLTNIGTISSGNITSSGIITAEGGELYLGEADTASAHINSYEVMTFNIDSDNDDANRHFAWYSNGNSGSGTHLMRLTENGQLAIGTQNPSRTLHIRDSGQIKLESTSTGSWTGLDFAGGSGSYDMYMGMLDSDGRFFIDVNSNGEDFTILQNGNVGIGTTSPQAKLDIQGITASSSPVMRFTGTGNASAGDVIGQIEFYNSDTTDNTAGVMGKIRAIAGASGGEGSIQILTDMPSEGADAATVAAHFHGNGKVGIGTASPLQKLSVNGIINSDSDQDYYGAWMTGNTATNGYSYMAVGEWYSVGLYLQKKTGENRTHIYNYNANHPLIINAGSSTNGETTSSKSRLGIGTFSPNAVVHIQGQNPSGLIVENGAGNASTQPYVSMAANNYSSGYGTFRWEDQRASQASPSFIWEVRDGSGTALAYDFRTGATGASGSKLAITQSGNVGIGNSSPGYLLEVGSATQTNSNVFSGRVNGDFIFNLSKANTNLFSIRNNANSVVHVNTQNSARLAFGVSTSTGTGTIQEDVTLVSGGNVGIGNANPTSNLTIGSAQSDGLEFTYDGSNSYRNRIVNYWNSNTDTRMDFEIGRTGNVAPTTVLSVGYNTNVGIGTSAPATKFEVRGTSQIGMRFDTNSKSLIRLLNNTIGLGERTDLGIGFSAISGYGGTYPLSGITGGWDDDTSGGLLSFRTSTDGGTTWPSRMVIKHDGRVGIGTSSPAGYLHVNESINGTSDYYFSNLDTTSGSTSHKVALHLSLNRTGGGMNLAAGKIVAGKEREWIGSPPNQDGYLAFETTLNEVSNERMRINSVGNVGIGESAPDTQLHLSKASNTSDVDYIKFEMPSWAGHTGKLKSLVWHDSANNIAAIGAEYDGSKTNIHFHSQYNGGYRGTSDKTLSILGNGNVGIGTTSPNSKLEVRNSSGAGNGSAQEVGRFVNTSSGATSMYLYLGASTGTDWRLGKNVTGIAGNTSFSISNHIGTRMLDITGDGTLGLGTTTPITPSHKEATVTASTGSANTWSISTSGVYSARGGIEVAGITNRFIGKFGLSGNFSANTWYVFTKRSNLVSMAGNSESDLNGGFGIYFRIWTYTSSVGMSDYLTNRVTETVWIISYASNSIAASEIRVGAPFGHAPNTGHNADDTSSSPIRIKAQHHSGSHSTWAGDQTFEIMLPNGITGADPAAAGKQIIIYAYMI